MGSEWDIIVAGAGPAGCVLAAKVAASGAKVLLLEKEASIGENRDWVVDVEQSAFQSAGVPTPEGASKWIHPARTILVSPDGQQEIEELHAPVVPVRNGMYVRQLASWAKSEGAILRTSCAVTGPVVKGGAVTGVHVSGSGGEEEFTAKLIADCTGIGGAVRRGTPPEWGLAGEVFDSDIVLARREVRQVADCESASSGQDCCMRDGLRIDRPGFAGAYSVETCHLSLRDGTVDVLVGVKPEAGIHPEERVAERFLRAGFAGELIFGGGAAIPIRRTWDSLVGNGLLVLGDSACQTIPAHGSGTASALIAASTAAQTAIRAIREGDSRAQSLWEYCHRFQSSRGALLAYYDVMRKHSEELTAADLNRLIARGLLGSREIYSGLVPEPFEPTPLELMGKLGRGARASRLILGFARAGLLARKVMSHYRNYPRRYDPHALKEWSRSIPRY